MTLIVTSESEINRVATPALPLAPEIYNRSYQDQLNNVLRLYFNRVDNILGQISASTDTLEAVNGGTGFSSYVVGDLLYANTTTTLAKLPIGLNTYVLTSNGTTVSWAPGGGGSGTVTSVSGTGTVSGLTLSGTVTTSGNLTLGGSITGFATSGANTNLTSVALTSGTITTAPSTGNDIVNKTYADAIASGIHFHEAVSLATTAALPANTYNNGTSGVGATLTATANGALSVDSTLTIVAERILVKNETAGANNGVYVVTQVGSAGAPYILTRATDFDTVGTGVDQIDEGDFFLVTNGVANLNTAWVQQTAPPITIGTTAIVFQQFAAPTTQVYPSGTGIAVVTSGTSWGTTLTAPSGVVVGTTDTQTLTNKTLTSPVIGTISNTGTLTLPTSTDTLVGRATTDTLTNKRIDPRVVSAASASSLTPSIATADIYAYTALAAGLTINAPVGTPVDGNKLTFRLLDNGTARALTWNATYTVIGVTLPTTTVANKTTYVGCIYNANNTRWDVIAVATQA